VTVAASEATTLWQDTNVYIITVTSMVMCLVASVCMSLTKALTYKVHFGLQVHLQGTWIKVIYEGHQIKVKVTGPR